MIKINVSSMLLIIFLVMGGIAYVSGGEVALTYGTHTIYDGHQIFIANENNAQIDGNPVKVIHTGYIGLQTFKINEVYKNAVILDHSIYGISGDEEPINMNINSKSEKIFPIGENISFLGLNMVYAGDIGDYHTYSTNMNNMTIGINNNGYVLLNIGQSVFMMTVVHSNGNTYIEFVKEMYNNYAISSIMLMVFFGLIIYLVGFITTMKK